MTNYHFEFSFVLYLRLGIYLWQLILSTNIFEGSVNRAYSLFNRLVRVADIRRNQFDVRIRSNNFFASASLSLNNAVSQLQEIFTQRLRRTTFFDFVRRRPGLSLAFFLTFTAAITSLIRNRANFRQILEWIYNPLNNPGNSTPVPVPAPSGGNSQEELSIHQHLVIVFELLWKKIFK